MANALLYPGWAFNGLRETGNRHPVVSVLNRPATDIELVRMIPWSDPESGGTDDFPYFFEDAEQTWLQEDKATGAIIEVRGVFAGEVFERHSWDELAFDVPLDPALFDPDVVPDLAPWPQPFVSTVTPSLGESPPALVIEDPADPSVRQTGLLLAQYWPIVVGQRPVREPGKEHPWPPDAGPFGRNVRFRLDTLAMPFSMHGALFGPDGRHIRTYVNVVAENVGSEYQPDGRIIRDHDGTVFADVTLPVQAPRLSMLVGATWMQTSLPRDSHDIRHEHYRAEYAFALTFRDDESHMTRVRR